MGFSVLVWGVIASPSDESMVKNHFTILELDRILKLKSVYSIRLYEILLKEYCYYGKKKISFVFSIKELKAMLGLEVNQYSEIITFKRKILDIDI